MSFYLDQFQGLFICLLASWYLAIKSEEGKRATFSQRPKLDTLLATQVWILLRCLMEAKNTKKAVLKVKCLISVSFIGSKGAFVSSLRTQERCFSWASFRNFWVDPCES